MTHHWTWDELGYSLVQKTHPTINLKKTNPPHSHRNHSIRNYLCGFIPFTNVAITRGQRNKNRNILIEVVMYYWKMKADDVATKETVVISSSLISFIKIVDCNQWIDENTGSHRESLLLDAIRSKRTLTWNSTVLATKLNHNEKSALINLINFLYVIVISLIDYKAFVFCCIHRMLLDKGARK